MSEEHAQANLSDDEEEQITAQQVKEKRSDADLSL